MSLRLPKLIPTSVVRGSNQGESHGGVVTGNFDVSARDCDSPT
jgi:hypothetical protein